MSAPYPFTHTNGERFQTKVRRVPVIQFPFVARVPLVRHHEPPAVIQPAIRQPVRNARQASAARNGGRLRLQPPRAQRERLVILALDQVRPDQLLDVPMLCLRKLLVLPRGLDAQVLSQQAAQLALGTGTLVAGVGTRHPQFPSASSCSRASASASHSPITRTASAKMSGPHHV